MRTLYDRMKLQSGDVTNIARRMMGRGPLAVSPRVPDVAQLFNNGLLARGSVDGAGEANYIFSQPSYNPNAANGLQGLGFFSAAVGGKYPVANTDVGFDDTWANEWYTCLPGSRCEGWVKHYNYWNKSNAQEYNRPSDGVNRRAGDNYAVLKANVEAGAPGADEALAAWKGRLLNALKSSEAAKGGLDVFGSPGNDSAGLALLMANRNVARVVTDLANLKVSSWTPPPDVTPKYTPSSVTPKYTPSSTSTPGDSTSTSPGLPILPIAIGVGVLGVIGYLAMRKKKE